MADPVPAGVPPQLAVNHSQVAPVPSEPPFTDNWVELLWQMGFTVALMPAGAAEVVSGVNAMLWQAVFPQTFSPRTKYVVGPEGAFMVKDAFPAVEVPISVPPQDPEYQYQVPTVPLEPPFWVSVMDVPGHTLFALTAADEGAVNGVS